MSNNWGVGDVKALVSARAGRGKATWEIDGTVISASTGRKICDIRGIEEIILERPFHRHAAAKKTHSQTVKLTQQENNHVVNSIPDISHSARLVARASLFYTTGDAILREFRHNPTAVRRIVHQPLGAARRVTMARGKGGELIVRREGRNERWAVASRCDQVGRAVAGGWGFVGRRIDTGNKGISSPGIVERADIIGGHDGARWVWSGVGRCPAWYGRGICVTFLTARRVKNAHIESPVRAWMAEFGISSLQVADADEAERKLNMSQVVVKRKKVLGIF